MNAFATQVGGIYSHMNQELNKSNSRGRVDADRPSKRCFIDVVVEGRLAFRYDPLRDLVQWRRGGKTYLIDLKAYKAAATN